MVPQDHWMTESIRGYVERNFAQQKPTEKEPKQEEQQD
jgi:hypothetical protein